MPRPATGWRALTKRWGLRRMRDCRNLSPTPGAPTSCAPKATPFARTSTRRSKSFTWPCSCVPMRQNFTKHSEKLYLGNHTDEKAQSELERALALDPSRTHALYLLGRLYVQKRDNEKALSYLQLALRLQPDLAEASSLLGTAYVRLGQFANAIPKLEKAAPIDHYGNVHYQLYLAYRKL